MDRALLVGINEFPGAPLAGCVNDVQSMAELLTTRCGFAKDNIRWLTDSRATTDEILTRLRWLVEGALPGDRRVFHYSGHGAQMATRNAAATEVDGLDEVICPVDFDWTDEHMIRDKQLVEIFSSVPPGVHFVWISDACHARGQDRSIERSFDFTLAPRVVTGRRRRVLSPPADIAWRISTARDKGLLSVTQRGGMNLLNVAFIAACQSNELATDTVIDGVPCGALTHYLVERLRQGDGLSLPLSKIVEDVTRRLAANNYDQHPQLDGPLANVSEAFMATTTLTDLIASRLEIRATHAVHAATPHVDKSDLVNGDVILYRGTDWTACALAYFDKSHVSNAAMYVGKGKVIEVRSEGLMQNKIGEVLAGQNQILVRRGKRPDAAQALVENANALVGDPQYAGYDPLVMVALLAISRKIPTTPVLPILLRNILDAATTSLIRRGAATKPAGTAIVVSLPIKPQKPARSDAHKIQHGSVIETLRHLTDCATPSPALTVSADDATLASLWMRYENEVAIGAVGPTMEDVAAAVGDDVSRLALALHRTANGTADKGRPAAIQNLVSIANTFQTPGDLARSRNFIDVGYLNRVPREKGRGGEVANALKKAGVR